MKNALTPLCFAAGLSLLAGAALAQGRPATADPGKREFDANCASCHGTSGKGDGPLVPFLTRSPPDLTQLAKRNGGVLPMSRLYDVIDGAEVPAHGSRDMPVWGRDYRVKDAEYFMEAPY
ncbi:MAG: cytochrome c, partial [Hydrogenophaga sp.]|nr:cytochrome c [Hydrogenophaga sp.]